MRVKTRQIQLRHRPICLLVILRIDTPSRRRARTLPDLQAEDRSCQENCHGGWTCRSTSCMCSLRLLNLADIHTLLILQLLVCMLLPPTLRSSNTSILPRMGAPLDPIYAPSIPAQLGGYIYSVYPSGMYAAPPTSARSNAPNPPSSRYLGTPSFPYSPSPMFHPPPFPLGSPDHASCQSQLTPVELSFIRYPRSGGLFNHCLEIVTYPLGGFKKEFPRATDSSLLAAA